MNITLSAEGKSESSRRRKVVLFSIFLLIAAIGLAYVKWWPYYFKALRAISEHTIGSSIVTGADATNAPSWQAAWEYSKKYFLAVWQAALLGLFLGSLAQVLIPKDWLLRVLGKSTFGSTATAGLASIPGMMCTCCAAPIAAGLRKQNVSVGAALAFWLGNPTINPAVLIFMTFVLSWKFAVLRLVFGLILVFGVSYWANRIAGHVTTKDPLLKEATTFHEEKGTFWQRWLRSFVSLFWHLVPAYIVVVLILGAVRGFLFPILEPSIANSLLAIIGIAIAGTLFVIPTAAEIPMMQTLIANGWGAGPAAALSLTLPAVSLPSLIMLSRSFPLRVIIFVAASVLILGIASGIAGILLIG